GTRLYRRARIKYRSRCRPADRTILGRISKRGNRYLRTLFMQGARVIGLRPASWAKHSFGPWLMAAAKRLHHNVMAVALANKLAPIAWSVLAQRRAGREIESFGRAHAQLTVEVCELD